MTDFSPGAASAPRASSAPHAPRIFTLSDFDFSLPPALIAQHPAPERSASRLLDGRAMQPVDRIFRELPGLLFGGRLLPSALSGLLMGTLLYGLFDYLLDVPLPLGLFAAFVES